MVAETLDISKVVMARKDKPEIYLSGDVEADGPIPGPNSMLSFGLAAYTPNKQLLSTFSANLELLPGAAGDPSTMKWWDGQKEAWEACRKDLQSPKKAMHDCVNWIEGLEKKHGARSVFVGYPVAYDFMFIYWYMMKFVGRSPFRHSGLDIKTLAFSQLCQQGKGYRGSVKRSMPKRWFDKLPHTHVALDDAIEQGALFCNLLKEVKAKGIE